MAISQNQNEIGTDGATPGAAASAADPRETTVNTAGKQAAAAAEAAAPGAAASVSISFWFWFCDVFVSILFNFVMSPRLQLAISINDLF